MSTRRFGLDSGGGSYANDANDHGKQRDFHWVTSQITPR